MARKEEIMVNRTIPLEEIQVRIRSIEKDVRILKRLYFIKYRYQGSSVAEASKNVGVTKMVGYYWQESWNREGFSGLTPRFAGGKPSRLSEEQKVELKSILEKRDDWTTEEVRKMIKEKFNVEYCIKHVRKMLKKMGIHYSKPYQHDYRRPGNAEENLKKLRES
ncbi:MAG: transposase [Thermoplasmatales archaeon]|jgi:putative transposase|nr:transposase [Candidatus Thermoplasmatota archaeon]MDA8055892.1 transposase [Thermoplasmatales archaeon]